MMVNVWLECMWRPLALVCLETKQEQMQTRQLLAEALLATLAAIEVAGESRTPFAAAPEWPAAVAEVAHVLSLIMASWEWRVRSGSGKAAATATRRASVAAEDPYMVVTSAESSPGLIMENAKGPLLKLAARFSSSGAQDVAGVAESWTQVQSEAKRRCQVLCSAFASLGVDTSGIVTAATEAVRVRPSRAFLSGPVKRRRRISKIATRTPRRARRLSRMGGKQRRKKANLSDDDSDAPTPAVQDPYHQVEDPHFSASEDAAATKRQRREKPCEADLCENHAKRASKALRRQRGPHHDEDDEEDTNAQVKLQRRALAFGF